MKTNEELEKEILEELEENDNENLKILDGVFHDFKTHTDMNKISEFLRNNLILRGSHYGRKRAIDLAFKAKDKHFQDFKKSLRKILDNGGDPIDVCNELKNKLGGKDENRM